MTLILVALDQVTKVFIFASYMNVNYEIIPDILAFKPVFNNKYSFVNSLLYQNFGINTGLIFHLLLFFAIWLLVFGLYRFYKTLSTRNKYLDATFCFFNAATICAYFGCIIWKNGTLDFIEFKLLGNVICDFKDIYINIFIAAWIVCSAYLGIKHKVRTIDILKFMFRRKSKTSEEIKVSSEDINN